MKVIEKCKKDYPDIKVFIDTNRDAIGDGSKKIKVSTVAFGQQIAKVMLVVGTDKLGLYHPFWRENLTFALHLQKNLIKICPQITKPINISAARYNQHISPYALIIEIGTNGNTLDEALKSCHIVAKALDDAIMGR
ncbi:stage II sporulation protein P [Caldicellulosiruptor naganoensis]|uniref:Stage II sporulation protein P n=1 Tax=Caldicellulosiruptor naganoensis TaxID=29324 RepID=A0ABY7BIZ2_9FIRM|nr:stage II sporulation protein P [Caldicellulosiruptor naganoensis]WAM32383.1 stage II sporulation protein P [Caldicellulosiruptor naganoensis]